MTNDALNLADRHPEFDARDPGIARYRKAKRRAYRDSSLKTGDVTGISQRLSAVADALPTDLERAKGAVPAAPTPPPADAPLRPHPATSRGPQPPPIRRRMEAPVSSVTPAAPNRRSMVDRLADAGDRSATIGPISWGFGGSTGAGAFLLVASLLPGPAGQLLGAPAGIAVGALALFAVSIVGGTLRPILLLLPFARPGLVHTPPTRPLFDAPGLMLAGGAWVAGATRLLSGRVAVATAGPRLRPARPLLPALALCVAVLGVASALRAQPAADAKPSARSAGSAIHATAERVLLGEVR